MLSLIQEPHERARLYFLLAWFHAIIQERLHYAPLGWSKKYEFNESDLRMACDTLDTWLETVSQVRPRSSKLRVKAVPSSCIHTYICQIVWTIIDPIWCKCVCVGGGGGGGHKFLVMYVYNSPTAEKSVVHNHSLSLPHRVAPTSLQTRSHGAPSGPFSLSASTEEGSTTTLIRGYSTPLSIDCSP